MSFAAEGDQEYLGEQPVSSFEPSERAYEVEAGEEVSGAVFS
jgi:hypothetical protein